MAATIDGHILFDEQQLEIEAGALSRDSIEKKAAGLDGVLSIDLGRAARKIRQKGILRAASRLQLQEKISVISAYMDGKTYKLVAGGEEFDDLRMDALKTGRQAPSGNGVTVDYEIIYTQLVV